MNLIDKVVVCDSTYSGFFSDLVDELEIKQKNTISRNTLSTFFSEKLFLPDFNKVNIEFKNNWRDAEGIVLNIISLANLDKSLSGIELEYVAMYFLGLDDYMSRLDKNNTLFLIYNDLRWDHALIIFLCKKYDFKYCVFELGVFRPNSMTMDFAGVNSRSQFSVSPFNELNMKESYFDLDSIYSRPRRSHRSYELKFSFYMLVKSIEMFFARKELKAIYTLSRRKGYKDYLKLKCKRVFESLFSRKNNFNIDTEYIFVPLQLSNDTQTIVNSEFKSTQEFIDRVTVDFFYSSLSDKYKLVFKVHPMDVEQYKFDTRVLTSDYSTNTLIKRSSLVVTINSTVGFEASFLKPVICCGDSFYTEHGVVHKADLCDNIFLNADSIMGSKDYSSAYKYFVLEYYQLPGGMYNYDEDDVSYSSAKIVKWYLNEK